MYSDLFVCVAYSYLYERIGGRVRCNLRQAAIDCFSKPDSDPFMFLLCKQAGGLGISSVSTSPQQTPALLSTPNWNPQKNLQVTLAGPLLKGRSKLHYLLACLLYSVL